MKGYWLKMAGKSRHLLVAQLLADGSLTDTERAEIAHCSLRTIGRVRKELRQEVESDEGVLERFKRHLEKRLPVERCVDELVKLMLQDEHRPSKMAAIKRYQEILGMVTAREAKKVEEKRQPGPMFIFPPGSQPILTVTPPDAANERSSAKDAHEIEAIELLEDESG